MTTWAEVLAELEAEADALEASLAADRAFAAQTEWHPPAMDTPPTEADLERIKMLLRRQEILQNQLQVRIATAPVFRPHIPTRSEAAPSVLDRSA
jgi:hypothetical protein